MAWISEARIELHHLAAMAVGQQKRPVDAPRLLQAPLNESCKDLQRRS